MNYGVFDVSVQFRRGTVTDDGYQSAIRWNSANPELDNLGLPELAAREFIRDAERYAAGTVGVDAVARFVVRYSSFTAGITHKDRLVCEGRTYGITGIKELGRRVGFEITASEVRE